MAEWTQNTQHQRELRLGCLVGPGVWQGRWLDDRAACRHMEAGWFDQKLQLETFFHSFFSFIIIIIYVLDGTLVLSSPKCP